MDWEYAKHDYHPSACTCVRCEEGRKKGIHPRDCTCSKCMRERGSLEQRRAKEERKRLEEEKRNQRERWKTIETTLNKGPSNHPIRPKVEPQAEETDEEYLRRRAERELNIRASMDAGLSGRSPEEYKKRLREYGEEIAKKERAAQSSERSGHIRKWTESTRTGSDTPPDARTSASPPGTPPPINPIDRGKGGGGRERRLPSAFVGIVGIILAVGLPVGAIFLMLSGSDPAVAVAPTPTPTVTPTATEAPVMAPTPTTEQVVASTATPTPTATPTAPPTETPIPTPTSIPIYQYPVPGMQAFAQCLVDEGAIVYISNVRHCEIADPDWQSKLSTPAPLPTATPTPLPTATPTLVAEYRHVMGALVNDFSACTNVGGRVEKEKTTKYTEEYVCYVSDPEWTYERGSIYWPGEGGGGSGGGSSVTTASATRSSGSLLTLTFACTGSMEPAITCLDTGTADSDYGPEDISIGVVVSIDLSQDGCSISGSNILHRVSDLRGSDESLEVRTKGDANRQDDGCWVPYSRINSILIEVHKGANSTPENVSARNRRTEAKAELDRVRAELDRMKTELDRARSQADSAGQTYESYVGLHCTNRGGTWECPSSHIGEAQRLYSAAEAANSLYNQIVGSYNALLNRYNALADAYAAL